MYKLRIQLIDLFIVYSDKIINYEFMAKGSNPFKQKGYLTLTFVLIDEFDSGSVWTLSKHLKHAN